MRVATSFRPGLKALKLLTVGVPYEYRCHHSLLTPNSCLTIGFQKLITLPLERLPHRLQNAITAISRNRRRGRVAISFRPPLTG
jgi:hypothetical protein